MNDTVVVSAVIGAGIALVLIRLASLERRLNRLSRLDAKVDALLESAGIRFDEFHDVPAEVREALDRGETVLAIKRFREATGAGLKEARNYVNEAPPRSDGKLAQAG